MRRKSSFGLFTVYVAAVLVPAGCGGSGSSSHSYVMTPTSQLATGIYVTLVSPVTLPQGLLDKIKTKSGLSFVRHAQGPQNCSFSKTVTGVKGRYAYLNGKPMTLKINGSNPLISLMCSGLEKGPFKLTGFGTSSPVTTPVTAGGRPSIVTHVHVRSGRTWLAISWARATAAPGGEIYEYEADAIDGSTGEDHGTAVYGLSSRINGLIAHHTYAVTVTAVGGHGVLAPPSRPVRATTG